MTMDQTVLVGDAARQCRAAFAERKTVPVRVGGRVVGSAELQPDGTAQITVTNETLQAMLRVDLSMLSVSFL